MVFRQYHMFSSTFVIFLEDCVPSGKVVWVYFMATFILYACGVTIYWSIVRMTNERAYGCNSEHAYVL